GEGCDGAGILHEQRVPEPFYVMGKIERLRAVREVPGVSVAGIDDHARLRVAFCALAGQKRLATWQLAQVRSAGIDTWRQRGDDSAPAPGAVAICRRSLPVLLPGTGDDRRLEHPPVRESIVFDGDHDL